MAFPAILYLGIDHSKRELASFLPRRDPAISPRANNLRKHLLFSLTQPSIRSTKIPSKSSPSSLVPTSSLFKPHPHIQQAQDKADNNTLPRSKQEPLNKN